MKAINNLLITESLVDGKWISGKNTFDVVNPANGKTIAKVADLTVSETKQAIKVADKAWRVWKNTTAEERGNLLYSWYKLIIQNKDQLAEIMTLECGKPITESYSEINYGASFISWFSEEGKRAYGETTPSSNPASRIVTIKQSI